MKWSGGARGLCLSAVSLPAAGVSLCTSSSSSSTCSGTRSSSWELTCAYYAAAHTLQGIVNRLAVDEAEVEERVFVEAITNQYESREAVKYAGGCCCCCACWACWACPCWVWTGMC